MRMPNSLIALIITTIALLLAPAAQSQDTKEFTFKYGPVTIVIDNTDPNHPVTKAKLDCDKKIDVTGKVCITANDKTNQVTAEQKYTTEIKKLFSCEDPEKCELIVSSMSSQETGKNCEGGKEWEVKLRVKCRKKGVKTP